VCFTFKDIRMIVFDMSGNEVKTLINKIKGAGFNSVQRHATNNQVEPISAGLYLYSIETDDFIQTRKMILLK